MAFRNTAIGLALADAIATVKAAGQRHENDGEEVTVLRPKAEFGGGAPGLTQEQEAAVWRAFEASMVEALTEAPANHIVKITALPAAPDAGSELPAYRCVDGEWTVALGPSNVEMSVPGASLKINADFVMIHAIQPRGPTR